VGRSSVRDGFGRSAAVAGDRQPAIEDGLPGDPAVMEDRLESRSADPRVDRVLGMDAEREGTPEEAADERRGADDRANPQAIARVDEAVPRAAQST
jgi:hypothetical protein